MNNLDLVILPSGSRLDRDWVMKLKSYLDSSFKSIYPVEYENWRDGNGIFEIYKESQEIKDQTSKTANYGLICYKEGCALALKSLAEGLVKPQFVVFIGFPYAWSLALKLNDEISSWLYKLNVKSLFIQGEKDAQIPSDKLKILLENKVKASYQVKSIYNESDGNYEDFSLIIKLIRDFL